MTDPDAGNIRRPALPPGREVRLPRRGTTFVRELPGPPGAPTVLLLHGWTANADLNWFGCYEELGRRYRVVALDHRGHGRGIRTRRPVRLVDCADDAAVLLAELGIESALVVGYSMGGAIAQLVWRRHRALVDGLVLCATALTFSTRTDERLRFAALTSVAMFSYAMPRAASNAAAARLLRSRRAAVELDPWVREELHRNDWTAILHAGSSIGRFDSRGWIGEVDVPTSVVLTTSDQIVSPDRQLALAQSIPGATIHRVEGRHTVCATHPERFVPVLLDACADVATPGDSSKSA